MFSLACSLSLYFSLLSHSPSLSFSLVEFSQKPLICI
ncbi:hypothetical protein AAZX31_05G099900 [Glycine max]